MPDLPFILITVNLVIALGMLLGGYIVIRSTMAKAASDIQERVREALEAENALLQDRIKRLEIENRRCTRAVQLIISTLRKTHHIEVEVGDEVITVRNQQGKIQSVQIRAATGELIEKKEEA